MRTRGFASTRLGVTTVTQDPSITVKRIAQNVARRLDIDGLARSGHTHRMLCDYILLPCLSFAHIPVLSWPPGPAVTHLESLDRIRCYRDFFAFSLDQKTLFDLSLRHQDIRFICIALIVDRPLTESIHCQRETEDGSRGLRPCVLSPYDLGNEVTLGVVMSLGAAEPV